MNYWVVGSLNVDFVVDVSRFPNPGETVRGSNFSTFLGGKGGNQAMALARLGCTPHIVGQVGTDQFGAMYRDALNDAGANVDSVRSNSSDSTGTALIEVEESGNNRIVIVPGANEAMTTEYVIPHLNMLAPGDFVLLQLEIPMRTVIDVARYCRGKGAVVMLDPAPADALSAELFGALDWITPNEHEAAVLTATDTSTPSGVQSAGFELLSRGVDHVVIKAGERGAWYFGNELDHCEEISAFRVTVVDTTAAGDSFNAGLAWALGKELGPIESIQRASAVAALSVTEKGAQTAMPTADEVEEFLRTRD